VQRHHPAAYAARLASVSNAAEISLTPLPSSFKIHSNMIPSVAIPAMIRAVPVAGVVVIIGN